MALGTALPLLAYRFETTLSLASLVSILYVLMFAGLILPVGWLMDRVDCFRLLRGGYYLFGIGSLCCIFSQTITQLCAGRLLQGSGGAVLYAVTPVLIRKFVPEDLRDRSYAQLSMVSQIGILLGPPLGGMLSAQWGWQSIFAMNIPIIAVALILLIGLAAPPDRNAVRRSFDSAGACLCFIASALFIFVLNQGYEFGWGSWEILTAEAACMISAFLFVLRQVRVREPLVDFKLLRIKEYRTGLITSLFALIAGAGVSFISPFFLTHVLGFTIFQSGFMLAIEPVGSVLTAGCSAAAVNRWGYAQLITGSMMARLLAMLMLAAATWAPFLNLVIIAFSISGLAEGMQYGPLMSETMAAIPAGEEGEGGALFSQTRLMAQMFGVLIFETIFSELHSLPPYPGAPDDRRDIAFSIAFILAAVLFAFGAMLAIRLRKR